MAEFKGYVVFALPADNSPAVRIPAEGFTIRMAETKPSSLTVLVPDLSGYTDVLAVNNRLRLSKHEQLNNGADIYTPILTVLIAAPFEASADTTGRNAGRIGGTAEKDYSGWWEWARAGKNVFHFAFPDPTETITLRGVSRIDSGRSLRVTCNPDPDIRPGMKAVYNGTSSLRVSSVEITVKPASAVMVVAAE